MSMSKTEGNTLPFFSMLKFQSSRSEKAKECDNSDDPTVKISTKMAKTTMQNAMLYSTIDNKL